MYQVTQISVVSYENWHFSQYSFMLVPGTLTFYDEADASYECMFSNSENHISISD
jgi:hypothetical protein